MTAPDDPRDRWAGPVIRQPQIFDSKRVISGFTTRREGVSDGAFVSLNLGSSTGDDTDRVEENRRIALAEMGLDSADLALAGQVHGGGVMYVRAPGVYRGVDALVADRPGLVLGILAADCAVVLLADEVVGIVAAVHAGWRGTVAGIVGATAETMVSLGAAVERVRAYLSPCISVERFEVGDEVAQQFDPLHVVRKRSWEKPHVDLKGAILRRLIDCGIARASIEVSAECTFDDDFFSHRASGGVTGRMMGFIALPPPRG